MNSKRSFRGLQPKIATLNRLYSVYVTKEGIFGGCVAGQLYDRLTAEAALQQVRLIAGPFIRICLKARRKREQFYRSLDLNSQSFLNADRRNFVITSHQIASIRLERGWSFWAMQSTGALTIELATGRRRKLILIGRQEPERVAELVRQCYPSLIVTGTPARIDVARRRLPSDAKNDRLITLAMISGIAVVTCIFAIIVEEPERFTTICFLLASLFFSVITYLLIRRWRKNEALKHLNDAIARSPVMSFLIARQREADVDHDQPSESN
jgi:hypothetical protein